MAGTDLTGILVVGAVLLAGVYLMQNPQILQNLGGGPAPPPMEEAAPAAEPEGEEEPLPPDESGEPIIQQEPFYIPVPVAVPLGYGYNPGYPRRQICMAEFGGSCNSECRHGPTQLCRDCVYFCGRPHFRDYDRVRRADPPYRRPRYVPPPPPPPPQPRPKPSGIPKCPHGTRWDRNDGKCVKIYGGPGPRPREECPRGQRFDWTKKKCMPVPKPTPTACPPNEVYNPTTKKCVFVPPNPTPSPPPTTTPPATTPPAPAPAPVESQYGYSYYGGYW